MQIFASIGDLVWNVFSTIVGIASDCERNLKIRWNLKINMIYIYLLNHSTKTKRINRLLLFNMLFDFLPNDADKKGQLVRLNIV